MVKLKILFTVWHYGLCCNRPMRYKITFSIWAGNYSLTWVQKEWRLLSYFIFLVRQTIKVRANKRILQYKPSRRAWFLVMWLCALQYSCGVFSEWFCDNLKRQPVSIKTNVHQITRANLFYYLSLSLSPSLSLFLSFHKDLITH